MKTARKVLLLALCAALLVSASVLGTIAYLTSTDSVKNTFTVGDVKITLDEAEVNKDGTVVEGAERVKANEYHLVPNHSYTKDPTVHVDADSDNCWIFVKIENGIADIEAATTVADQMTALGWTEIDTTNHIWAYKEIQSKGANVVVFNTFKIKSDVSNETLATYAGKTIVVTAYAVQSDGFTTAADAWNAAFASNSTVTE